MVILGGRLVDDDQVTAPEVPDQAGGGVDVERSSADDHGVGRGDRMDRSGYHIIVQRFLVEHHIGLDHAAAFAAGHALCLKYMLNGEEFPAFCAVVSQDAAVELEDLFASGGLMKAVDILGHDSAELSLLLKLSKANVSRVRLSVKEEHFLPVKTVEILGVPLKKGVAEDRFRGIVPLLVVKSVSAAEIRYAAFRGDSSASEKDDIPGIFHDLRKLPYLVHGISLQ